MYSYTTLTYDMDLAIGWHHWSSQSQSLATIGQLWKGAQVYKGMGGLAKMLKSTKLLTDA